MKAHAAIGVDAIPILMYHSLDDSGSVVSVDPRLFEKQMSLLSYEGFRGITVRDAVRVRRETGRWPARSVVITFDDGFANVVEHAAPVLLRLGFSATVYLVTDHVGGRNDWAPPPAGLGFRPLATWPQVAELAAAGWEIGAHTRGHPDLRGLPPDALENELAGSKRIIEGRLHTDVISFAYPYGRTDAAAIAAAGRTFQVCCTTVLRQARGEPFDRLPRVDMYYVRTTDDLRKLLNGRLDRYLACRRWARALRERIR